MSDTPRQASPAPEHRKLFTYLFRVFGIDLYGPKPVFKHGLVIGDTFITPDMARFFFAAATTAEAPPPLPVRAPEDTPPEPNPEEPPAPPKEPPIEKKPRLGQEQNKEDPDPDATVI